MKFKEILKIGAGVVASANPAVGAALGLVNKFLPDDEKLPESSTVKDISNKFENLPPEVQQSIQEQEIKFKIAESNNWVEVQRALNDADKSGASTRPYIAKLMAWCVALSIMPLSIGILYAVASGDSETIKAISDASLVVLALIGTPTALLNSYFGKRTKEKESRIQAAAGQPVNQTGAGLLGLVTGLIGKK